MANHILIEDSDGEKKVVKKSDIRRVHVVNKVTMVVFAGTKNTPIRVKESVEDFFNTYLGV